MPDQQDERFVIEGDPEDALREVLKVDSDSMPSLERELSDARGDVAGNREALDMTLEDAQRRHANPATDRAVRITRENVARAEANLRDTEQRHQRALDADSTT
jgi:hypothetical protein